MTLRVPGLSERSLELVIKLVDNDLNRTRIQVANANEIVPGGASEWRHLKRPTKRYSEQWFADKRRRISKLQTAQDELRRIQTAYHEARRQREQEALRHDDD